MGLSLQKKLELAGELAKVQPMLVRLRLIEKPKKRQPVRYLVIAGSVIAVGTIIAAVVFGRRRCGGTDGPDEVKGFAHTDPIAETPETASGFEAEHAQSAEMPG